MVPAEGSLVDLSEGETTTLIGILDVSEVIVEVVEGSVAAVRLLDSHCVKGGWTGCRRELLKQYVKESEILVE